MTQEHAKYEQEVIYGTTYDIYIYIYIEIKKIHIKLVYVGLAHARPNYGFFSHAIFSFVRMRGHLATNVTRRMQNIVGRA